MDMAKSPCKLQFKIGSLFHRAIAVAVIFLCLHPTQAFCQDPSPGHDLFGKSKVKTRFDNAFARYAAAPQDGFTGTIHDKWALLIGVSRYQDKLIAPMKMARNNIMLMSETLYNGGVGHFPPGHISYLLGANASRAMINGAFFSSALTHMALPGDLILIYICARTIQFNKEGEIGICTYDTIASEPHTSAINLKELLSNFRKRTQCPQIVCLLDCEPNAVNALQKGDPISLAELAKETGVTILASNTLSRASHPCGIGTFSCFCQFLTEALNSSSGMMPIGNLAAFIQDNVNAEHPDDENKQEITFAGPQGNDRAADLQLGAPIHAPWSISKATIGHNVDTLALDRPDLVETTPRKSKLYLKSHSGEQTVLDQASTNPKGQPDAPSPVQMVVDKNVNSAKAPESSDDSDGNTNLNPYIDKAKAAIKAKWHPPKELDGKQVITSFTVRQDGTVTDLAILSGSGNAGIDQEALRALKSATPLEPLPKGAPQTLELRYVFD